MIRRKRVALQSRPTMLMVRRVIVAEEMNLKPGHVGYATVHMPHRSLCDTPSDWLVEPRVISPDAVSARAVISDSVKMYYRFVMCLIACCI